MEFEYRAPKWPQPGNYRPNLEFLSLYSHSHTTKPNPLDPTYYQRYAKVKVVQESIEKELEASAAKVAKAEADLTAAEASIAENKWSKAATKLTNSQRLKNLLTELKKDEGLLRVKLHANTKDNSALFDIIRLQESMEKTYQDSLTH